MNEVDLQAPQPYHPRSCYPSSSNPYHDPYNQYSHRPLDYPFLDHGARIRDRTPSPTPSEIEVLKSGNYVYDPIREALAKARHWRTWRDFIPTFVIMFILVFVILKNIFQNRIIDALEPAARQMDTIPEGWLIPIPIMIILSFPPLVGNDLVAIMCGLVWGPWIGFAIVAVSTFLGETILFLTYRHVSLFRRMELKAQRKVLSEAVATIVNQGGLKTIVVARYSVVPSPFTTPVFAVSRYKVPLWQFLVAVTLSLPTQFANVWIGHNPREEGNSKIYRQDKILTYVMDGVTAAMTIAAVLYLHFNIERAIPEAMHKLRKMRHREDNLRASGNSQLSVNGLYHTGGLEATADVNGFTSAVEPSEQSVPLTSSYDQRNEFQQWDTHGRAIGYVSDPRFTTPTVHAPQPQRPVQSFPPSKNANSSLNVSTSAGPPWPGSRQDLERHQSGDTVRWENSANSEVPGNYRLNTMSPVSHLHNPFEDNTASAYPYTAPSGPQAPHRWGAQPAAYMSSPTTYVIPRAFAPPPPPLASRGGGAPKPGNGGAVAGYGFTTPHW